MREKSERWMELAKQAVNEQDPEKLMAIIREIDRLLEEKLSRLRGQRPIQPPSGARDSR
jgi:hypothetical protein